MSVEKVAYGQRGEIDLDHARPGHRKSMTKTDDERFKQWAEWIEVIYRDVQHVLLRRHILREVQAITASNADIARQSSIFFDWMASNYAAAQADRHPQQPACDESRPARCAVRRRSGCPRERCRAVVLRAAHRFHRSMP
jgi:hypothetical protein